MSSSLTLGQFFDALEAQKIARSHPTSLYNEKRGSRVFKTHKVSSRNANCVKMLALGHFLNVHRVPHRIGTVRLLIGTSSTSARQDLKTCTKQKSRIAPAPGDKVIYAFTQALRRVTRPTIVPVRTSLQARPFCQP